MAKKKDVQKEDNNTDSTKELDFIEDPEALELQELHERTNAILTDMRAKDNVWHLSPRAYEGLRLAMGALSVTNGMYSRVPLVCKGDECPYAEQCTLLPAGAANVGSYCQWEIAQIDLRAENYAKDIDFETASFTDRNLMSELITLDIMLERCKALLAKDGTPVIDMAIGVDSEGNEVRQPAVSKAWEAYEKVSKKRDQTYQLLMLTRKDKRSKDNDDDVQSVRDELQNAIDGLNVSI